MSKLFTIDRIALSAAIAEELSRQQPNLTSASVVMSACIEGSNFIADRVEQVPEPVREGMTVREWFESSDTGLSSMYMAYRMDDGTTRLPIQCYTFPYDPDDFGRCVRLVRAVGFSHKVYMMTGTGKEWDYIVKNWAQMVSLYDKQAWSDLGFMLKLARSHKTKPPEVEPNEMRSNLVDTINKAFSNE